MITFFSRCCVICRQPAARFQARLCHSCCRDLITQRIAQRLCRWCGDTVFDTVACVRCRREKPCWDRTVILSGDHGWINELLFRLNSRREMALVETLARFFLLYWRHRWSCPPVRLVPLPLERKLLWRRGFNQNVLIASLLAHWFSVPCDEALSADAVRLVWKGDPLAGPVALFVDFLSLPEVSSAARLLQEAGARPVVLWALSRSRSYGYDHP